MMSKKEREMFLDLHAKVTETHEGIQFIRYGIKVNGQEGLEPILAENHAVNKELKSDVKDLKDRTNFLWKITAKTRTSYELWGAIQRWAEQHKMFAFMFKILLNKTMAKVLLIFLGIICVALFGDSALNLLNRIAHLLK
jgi:hypothetical protein